MERVEASVNNDRVNLSQRALRLRGGGADAKRKEARKRKFGHLPTQESHDNEPTRTATGEHNAEPPVKKQKRKSESDPERPLPAPAEARDVEDEQNGAQAPETKTSEKPQRFIIFIGMHSCVARDNTCPKSLAAF